MEPLKDPILKRFRAALDEMYGLRRGGVPARHGRPVWEMNRLADLSTKIIVEEDGPFIHAMPYRAGSYNDERMPLMHDIRADGIDL
jgi:hypothetical protein